MPSGRRRRRRRSPSATATIASARSPGDRGTSGRPVRCASSTTTRPSWPLKSRLRSSTARFMSSSSAATRTSSNSRRAHRRARDGSLLNQASAAAIWSSKHSLPERNSLIWASVRVLWPFRTASRIPTLLSKFEYTAPLVYPAASAVSSTEVDRYPLVRNRVSAASIRDARARSCFCARVSRDKWNSPWSRSSGDCRTQPDDGGLSPARHVRAAQRRRGTGSGLQRRVWRAAPIGERPHPSRRPPAIACPRAGTSRDST